MNYDKNIPDGFSTVMPYFTVKDADLFMNFVIAAFNGSVIYENRYDDNSVQHVRLKIGDSIIMMNQANERYPANISQMHLYLDDVDQTYKQALSAGGRSLMEPNKRPHGDEMAGIVDPCGNIWWLATYTR